MKDWRKTEKEITVWLKRIKQRKKQRNKERMSVPKTERKEKEEKERNRCKEKREVGKKEVFLSADRIYWTLSTAQLSGMIFSEM